MKKILNLAILASLSTSSLICNNILADEDYYIGRPSLEVNIGKSFLLQNQLLNQKYDAENKPYSTPSEIDFATADHQLNTSVLFDILPQLKMGFIFGSTNPLGYFDESLIENSYKLGSNVDDIKLFETSASNPLGLISNNKEIFNHEMTALNEIYKAFTTTDIDRDDLNLVMCDYLSKDLSKKYGLNLYVSTPNREFLLFKLALKKIAPNSKEIFTDLEEGGGLRTSLTDSLQNIKNLPLQEVKRIHLVFQGDGADVDLSARNTLGECIDKLNNIADSALMQQGVNKITDVFAKIDYNINTAVDTDIPNAIKKAIKTYKDKIKPLFEQVANAFNHIQNLRDSNSNVGILEKFDELSKALDKINVHQLIITALNEGEQAEQESLDKLVSLKPDPGITLKAIKSINLQIKDDGANVDLSKQSTLEKCIDELNNIADLVLKQEGVKKITAVFDNINKAVNKAVDEALEGPNRFIDSYKDYIEKVLTEVEDTFSNFKELLDDDEKLTYYADGEYYDPIIERAQKEHIITQALKILNTQAAIKNIYENGLKEAEVKSAVKTWFVGGNVVGHNFAIADNVSFEFGASFGLGQLTKKETLSLITDADGNKKDDGDYTFKRSATVDGLTWFSGVNVGIKYAFSSYAKAGLSFNWQAYGNPGNGEVTETWYQTATPLKDNEPSINGVFDKTAQTMSNKDFIGLQNFGISLNFSLSM